MVKRKGETEHGKWALPGGFVDEGEDLHEAISREVLEETGAAIKFTYKDQYTTVGTPLRDPRGHAITIVHCVMIDPKDYNWEAGDDASELRWVDPVDLVDGNEIPLNDIAFDHLEIIRHIDSQIELANQHIKKVIKDTEDECSDCFAM